MRRKDLFSETVERSKGGLYSQPFKKLTPGANLGDDIKALINQRRRQVLVHSVIYYKLDDNIISDSKWSAWANELDTLQKLFPDEAKECVYSDAFENFDPSSGFNLPLDDPWAMRKAQQLLQWRDEGIS